MSKLRKTQKAARTSRATVPRSARADVVKAAGSKVRAKAQADFRRTVRR